jgi:hypothetical protein
MLCLSDAGSIPDRTIGMKFKFKERKAEGKQGSGMGLTREWKGFPSPWIPSPSKAKEWNGMERLFEGNTLELLGNRLIKSKFLFFQKIW